MNFASWFADIWGYEPFPWQSRLSQQWPAAIAVPTGSGKTAVIDAWLYHHLQGDPISRRFWYVVDRRVLVDEACRRAKHLVNHLDLDIFITRLRGGVFDEVEIPSLDQPAIICSTVDQMGSRLLFRGYGVGKSQLPLHAALAGTDALVVVDEAHISLPFVETVTAARSFGANVQLTPMSATLQIAAEPVLELDDADRRHPVLRQRLNASKTAKLTRGSIAAEAKKLRRQGAKTIGVWCNTVEVAVKAAKELERDGLTILITGRDRELDRDQLMQEWHPRLRSGSGEWPKVYVVSTQCLEVGIDWDFEAMVTECASLDSLRQRFGRLDRLGTLGQSSAVIVKPPRKVPVYGESAVETWKWLTSVATKEGVDFGINALPDAPQECSLAADHAPALLPAHLDAWSMTSVTNSSIPDVSPWLHGMDRVDRDVRVLWRDLPSGQLEMCESIQAMPPTMPETASVPIDRLLEVPGPTIRWRGSDDVELTRDVMPGDVVVVACNTAGLSPSPPTDVAEGASLAAQRPRIRFVGPHVLESLETLTTSELLAECAEKADLSQFSQPEVRPYPGGIVVSQRFATSERAGRRVSLREHSEGVAQRTREVAARCGLDDATVDLLHAAGQWHDVGKADPRMQAWLGSSGELLAKSGHTFSQMRAAWSASGYPRGQRHELMSATLARLAGQPDLVQHLIASHHGWCRPIVPEETDRSPVVVSIDWLGETVSAWSNAVRDEHENVFWALQAQLGWWTLAQLSGILVSVDHHVSREEQHAELTSASG